MYFWPYSTHTLIKGVAAQCGVIYPGDVVNQLNLNDQIAAVLSLDAGRDAEDTLLTI